MIRANLAGSASPEFADWKGVTSSGTTTYTIDPTKNYLVSGVVSIGSGAANADYCICAKIEGGVITELHKSSSSAIQLNSMSLSGTTLTMYGDRSGNAVQYVICTY